MKGQFSSLTKPVIVIALLVAIIAVIYVGGQGVLTSGGGWLDDILSGSAEAKDVPTPGGEEDGSGNGDGEGSGNGNGDGNGGGAPTASFVKVGDKQLESTGPDMTNSDEIKLAAKVENTGSGEGEYEVQFLNENGNQKFSNTLTLGAGESGWANVSTEFSGKSMGNYNDGYTVQLVRLGEQTDDQVDEVVAGDGQVQEDAADSSGWDWIYGGGEDQEGEGSPSASFLQLGHRAWTNPGSNEIKIRFWVENTGDAAGQYTIRVLNEENNQAFSKDMTVSAGGVGRHTFNTDGKMKNFGNYNGGYTVQLIRHDNVGDEQVQEVSVSDNEIPDQADQINGWYWKVGGDAQNPGGNGNGNGNGDGSNQLTDKIDDGDISVSHSYNRDTGTDDELSWDISVTNTYDKRVKFWIVIRKEGGGIFRTKTGTVDSGGTVSKSPGTGGAGSMGTSGEDVDGDDDGDYAYRIEFDAADASQSQLGPRVQVHTYTAQNSDVKNCEYGGFMGQDVDGCDWE